ncbi:hypothetical protein Q5H92_12820 [Hymenobacter sp. M29]|uniref:MerC domain-containing protein n=1 Tax=Hymenobacter mellowenesis TaxID=3063995 RepID=A0ABT9ACW4_9BACT|nr:hypothetical protein [Hymenobacter sp. M29]MDO7847247.1 hypothetical protein [Hymenobacter sp. M29]
MNLPDYSSLNLGLAYQIIKWAVLLMLIITASFWRKGGLLLNLLLVAGVAFTAIGSLFKISHWAFADVLMLSGAALLAVSYTWWYRAKPQCYLLDHLKLAWVLATGAAVVAVVFHGFIRPIAGIAEVLFWAMALLYIYQRWIQRPTQMAD